MTTFYGWMYHRPSRSIYVTREGYAALGRRDKLRVGCTGGWPEVCSEYVPRSQFAWCAHCLEVGA